MNSVTELVESLDVSVKANLAFDSLIDRLLATFRACGMAAPCSIIDDMAVYRAINEITLCITASGNDPRVVDLCRCALECSGISKNEIRIDADGIVKRRQIYFVKNSSGLIKIGSTMDVLSRVKGLQTGAGENLEVLVQMDGSTGMEKHLHKRFSGSNEHGEWFRPDIEVLEFIKSQRKDC